MAEQETSNIAETMSSIEISRNAKGDIQYKIKIYDEDPDKVWTKMQEIQGKVEAKFPVK